MTGNRSPAFVAYVYGGWHRSPWRGNLLEWDLLDNFKAYFPGHGPPLTPLDGRYDDSSFSVARRQIEVAHANGISAFTYFLYTDGRDFIMDAPIRRAFQAAPTVTADFGIGLTWCLRLPHHELPIPATFKEYRKSGTLTTAHSAGGSNLTMGEVLRMIDSDRRNQDEIELPVLLRTEQQSALLW